MDEFIGWGDKIKFNSISEDGEGINTAAFWEAIAPSIEGEKEKKKITVMETNEAGE